MAKLPFEVTVDKVGAVVKAMLALAENNVLIGIPSEKVTRMPEEGEDSSVNNAMIGYLNEFGSPEQNIPARPHLAVGIKNKREQTIGMFKRIAEDGIDKGAAYVLKGFHAVGAVNRDAVKQVLSDGLAPPLAPSTVEGRLRRHKGRKNTDLRPLIDTGQYQQAITYVIRKKA